MSTHRIIKRRKFEWITNFDKRGYVVCALLVFVLVLIHYRANLLALNVSSAISHEKNDMLTGSILVPYADDVCRQRLIDNATGQIRDGGFVNCDTATAHNNKAWAKIRTAE
jgi:hypothetical protein